MKSKIKYLSIALLSFATIGFNSCSKDGSSPIEVAEGTFVGEMTVYPAAGGLKTFEKGSVTITKAGEGQLKVTPDPSTGGSPRVFNVFDEDGAIVNKEDDPNGVFIYYIDNQTVVITSTKTTATAKDNHFRIRGDRKK